MKGYYRFGKRTVRQDMILSIVELEQPFNAPDGRVLTHVVNVDPICVDEPKFARIWAERHDVDKLLTDLDKIDEPVKVSKKKVSRAR